MRSMSWKYRMLAAVFALVGGVGLALAEEVTVRIVKDGEDQLRLAINGIEEIIRVDDLAEGEERTYAVGEHTITLTRANDQLKVSMDGEPFGDCHIAHGAGQMVWMSDDADCEVDVAGDGESRRVIVMKEGAEGSSSAAAYAMRLCHGEGDELSVDVEQIVGGLAEGDLEGLEELDLEIAGSPRVRVFSGGHGAAHPMVVTGGALRGDDVVRYRCQETGSELIVKRSDTIEDAYIDPATGCLMERVEEPEVHVVKIITRATGGEEEPND